MPGFAHISACCQKSWGVNYSLFLDGYNNILTPSIQRMEQMNYPIRIDTSNVYYDADVNEWIIPETVNVLFSGLHRFRSESEFNSIISWLNASDYRRLVVVKPVWLTDKYLLGRPPDATWSTTPNPYHFFYGSKNNFDVLGDALYIEQYFDGHIFKWDARGNISFVYKMYRLLCNPDLTVKSTIADSTINTSHFLNSDVDDVLFFCKYSNFGSAASAYMRGNDFYTSSISDRLFPNIGTGTWLLKGNDTDYITEMANNRIPGYLVDDVISNNIGSAVEAYAQSFLNGKIVFVHSAAIFAGVIYDKNQGNMQFMANLMTVFS